MQNKAQRQLKFIVRMMSFNYHYDAADIDPAGRTHARESLVGDTCPPRMEKQQRQIQVNSTIDADIGKTLSGHYSYCDFPTHLNH